MENDILVKLPDSDIRSMSNPPSKNVHPAVMGFYPWHLLHDDILRTDRIRVIISAPRSARSVSIPRISRTNSSAATSLAVVRKGVSVGALGIRAIV